MKKFLVLIMAILLVVAMLAVVGCPTKPKTGGDPGFLSDGAWYVRGNVIGDWAALDGTNDMASTDNVVFTLADVPVEKGIYQFKYGKDNAGSWESISLGVGDDDPEYVTIGTAVPVAYDDGVQTIKNNKNAKIAAAKSTLTFVLTLSGVNKTLGATTLITEADVTGDHALTRPADLYIRGAVVAEGWDPGCALTEDGSTLVFSKDPVRLMTGGFLFADSGWNFKYGGPGATTDGSSFAIVVDGDDMSITVDPSADFAVEVNLNTLQATITAK